MTFLKYAESIFKVLLTYFNFFKRIDIVFDVYLPNSLKAATREKRGRGVRKRVSAENKCPGNWLHGRRAAKMSETSPQFLCSMAFCAR